MRGLLAGDYGLEGADDVYAVRGAAGWVGGWQQCLREE